MELRFIILLTIWGISAPVFGQNLVPNPGFEAAKKQPVHLSSDGLVFERSIKHWIVPNEASTDLLTPRFKSSNLTPIPAHAGSNMAGIVINGDFWAEYVGVKLKKPLKPGTTYYVEWWMSLPIYYSKQKPVPTFLNDHFGVLFGKRQYKYSKEILLGKPQVAANDEILLEPTKWTKISSSFVATEEEHYLYLGQFFDESDPSKIAKGYFLVDDIFVEAFSSEAINYSPSRYYKIENGIASIKMENIYFQTDKYDLMPESFVELDKLVEILEKNPSIKIEIQGHTDDEGSETYNRTLSENRASSVREYLTSQGIQEDRLQSVGFGLSKPVAQNNDEVGRQANRRVEFVVRGSKQDTRKILDPEQIYRFADEVNPILHAELAFVGKDSRYWDCTEARAALTVESDADKRFSKYSPTAAHPFILKKTKAEQLVFINESNRFPQTRAFAQGMLAKLWEQGFRYLALQALNPADRQLSKRGYPVMNSGYSIKEPVYGDLVRQALALGFIIVPYAPTAEEVGKAEGIVKTKGKFGGADVLTKNATSWASAMNIARILRNDKGAKVVVLAKENDIREYSFDDRKNMGAWFKELTKINPLTIDQCRMIAHCPAENDPIYASLQLQAPTVFQRDQTECFVQKDYAGDQFKQNYDIQVFHAKHSYPYNRPAWLMMDNYRKPFEFNPDKHEMGYPCLVRAYKKGEDVNFAVPVDVIEIADPNNATSLLLPSGEYLLIFKDKKQAKQLEINIP